MDHKKYYTDQELEESIINYQNDYNHLYHSNINLNEIQQNIAYHSSIDDIIHLCSTNKKMRTMCSQKYFWDSLYQSYNLPVNNKTFKKFKDYLNHFIKSYNALLLAKYLSSLNKFEFKVLCHYGGTEEIFRSVQ